MKTITALLGGGVKKTVIVLALAACGLAFAGVPQVHAAAANIYVAQSAAGSGNGSSCANAYAYSFFNNSSNWGSGASQIGPGTTVHVCGTISVGANTEAFTFHGGGTSGNPITLYFEPGAVLSSPEWPADGQGGAIDVGSNSYVTIDGNGGVGGAEGVIQATSNGDSGARCLSGSCTSHGDSNGIEVNNGSTNLTVKGLTIADMYVTASGVPNGGGGSCMYVNGVITNWTITGNTMHDMGWCLSLTYSGGNSNGLTISNNNIYNIDHGIALGGYPSGANITNVNVFGNSIHDYSNWDTPGDVWHHDGIHVWGYNDNGSDAISNINIYDNKFGGSIGKNVTAHIFIEANGGNTKNVKIYNNTIMDTGAGADNDGLITTGQDSGYQIYNNTIIGTSGDTCVGLSSSPNNIFVNNIVSGCGNLQYITSGGGFASGGIHNNLYANCSGSNCFAYKGSYTGSFSSWQSSAGDANSTYASSLNLSAAGVPPSGSAALGGGANLTSLGISTLNSDIAGVARPASGAWDIGAYEVSSGSTGSGGAGGLPPPGPAAPVITSAGSASATAGTSFSYQIAASNSPTSYGASGLPSGLSMNSAGFISGTPTTAGTYNVTLSASNSGGAGTATLVLTVKASTPSTYTLTVSKAGTGTGTVSGNGISCGSTCSASVTSGATVTLSASPASGSAFTGWSGACSGTGSCSFTMSGAKSATATFGTVTPTGDTSAPSVPTGLQASAASASQVNLSWNASTDNVGVTGYNIYRNGTKIGSTASRSYSDTGLQASTAYAYAISAFDAAGNTSAQSAGVSATTQAASTSGSTTGSATCSTVNAGWTTFPVTAQSGTFTVSFDAIPSASNIDSVIGVSPSAAAAFTDMAAIVRFNDTGTVDVISGPGYTAASTYAYTGGTMYHFVMTVNLGAKTYTATVKSPTGSTTTIALNYPFRDTQATDASLAFVDAHNDAGTTSLCNVSVNGTSAGTGSSGSSGSSGSTGSTGSTGDNGGTTSGGVAPVITGTLAASGAAGSPFSYTITASNNPTSYGATGLPDGLSVNASTGAITGTPTDAGNYFATITATNSAGGDMESFIITISPSSSDTGSGSDTTGNGSGSGSGSGSTGGDSSSTIAALQAQIQSLLAQVAQLQAQLAAQNGGSPSTGAGGSGTSFPGPSFWRNLFYGTKGSDVSELQQFLINANTGSAAQALSQYGATGYFGASTKAALSEYQAAHDITPSNGYFGSKTRAYVGGE